ncbi:MAG: ABC transporter permease subunit [Deltaproteobacteria bacterium]|jgi:peptide/nickel transport system permease protein|nr:ABC transporter permease subunit [Deltaproteobacteria bacterium]
MIKLVLRRLLRNKSAIIGFVLIMVFVLSGIFAAFISPHDPLATDVTRKLEGSSWEYPLGTDQLGRDVLSRLIYGTRACLGSAILVTFVIILIGVPVGILSGYIGGLFDSLTMRVVDVCTTFPAILLALALVGNFQASLKLLVIVFICLWWAPFARLIRGLVMKIKEKDFILAAECGGSSRAAVIIKHIMPNVLSPIIVYGTLRIAAVIAHIAGFSFLGLGSQPPTPDWGVMLSDGRQFLTSKPMLLLWPGFAIMLSVLAFNLFGEGLGEALTPDPEDLSKSKDDEYTDEEDDEETKDEGAEPEQEEALCSTDTGGEEPILSVKDLKTYFASGNTVVKAVDGVSLNLFKGKITALVGGSGSGKSIIAQSIFNLVDKPGFIEGGEIDVEGENILSLDEKALEKYRGSKVAMIFQDPVGSMDQVIKVKSHLFEAARTPRGEKKEAMEEFKEVLLRVGLKDPDKVLESYPFELSGGMCQRVMVAMGLEAKADILIADEPTSSLDLTTQAAILDEFIRLKNTGLAILLITHDLGVVAQTADDVYVIHEGHIVECGAVNDVLLKPKAEFTKKLLKLTGV